MSKIFISEPFFLIISGPNSTAYSNDITYSTIINAVENIGKCTNDVASKESVPNTHKTGDNVTDLSSSMELEQDEIFRSMKINDASKTPYSDATQVRRI